MDEKYTTVPQAFPVVLVPLPAVNGAAGGESLCDRGAESTIAVRLRYGRFGSSKNVEKPAGQPERSGIQERGASGEFPDLFNGKHTTVLHLLDKDIL